MPDEYPELSVTLKAAPTWQFNDDPAYKEPYVLNWRVVWLALACGLAIGFAAARIWIGE